MNDLVLVCFAVRDEAKFFQKFAAGRENIRVLITGMGTRNAEAAVRKALAQGRPSRIFTCGFAGGLDFLLRIGNVVFDQATTPGEMASRLSAAGARPVSFLCSERVIITSVEKTALYASSGADAVEMESAAIQRVCAQERVPCVTVRAITDTASEDLPLDFNVLMTRKQRLSYTRLVLALLKSPRCVPGLMRLRYHSTLAARELARVLSEII